MASASTTRDNARQVYLELAHLVRDKRFPRLQKLCKPLDASKSIRIRKRNAAYYALSADAPSAEGLNLVVCCLDEGHAHPGNGALYKTLAYSTIAREDGLFVSISTAGDDRTHWYYQLYQNAKRILSGEDTDVTTYAEVYEAPEGADLEDPATWAAANPSLGTSFTEDAFRLDLQAAKSNLADWLNFQRYRLGVWCSSADKIWLDVGTWDKCRQDVPDEVLVRCPCVLGVDLSQTEDPTSVSACWSLGGRKYHVRSWAFVAREGVKKREKSNLPKYTQFEAEGSMTITSGNMIDAAAVTKFVLDLCRRYQVKSVNLDPSGAYVLATELAGHGIECQRVPQSHRYYSEPMKEFEKAVKERTLTHDGSSWLRWCVQNVRLDCDRHGNVRPDSGRSTDHIDGAVSALLAWMSCYPLGADIPKKSSVYERRGLVVLSA